MNTYLHKVQYYETDMMGVVHHANYIRWMEEARIDFMDRIGFPYKRMEAEGFLTRDKGKADARQVIVHLTEKGRALEAQAGCIPFQLGKAVACRSITPETAPGLYETLDDLIQTLSSAGR